MAYKKIFSETETDPAEYEPMDPVECVECGEVYDMEDDDIHMCSDGEYRCSVCRLELGEDDDF